MSPHDRLRALFDVVIDEVKRNPELANRVEVALQELRSEHTSRAQEQSKSMASTARNRRTQAVLDPVKLAQQDVVVLTERLQSLGLEQLRDIVAEYGMDPQRLVMKWKTKEKVVEHIVTMAVQRSRKGEAFR